LRLLLRQGAAGVGRPAGRGRFWLHGGAAQASADPVALTTWHRPFAVGQQMS